MSRAMFGPSKTLKLTSSGAGQPPRASRPHSHDSISLGRLPGLLLPLSSLTPQKSSEMQVTPMGHLADAQSHCGKSGGIFPGMTCGFSLCHPSSQAMTPQSEMATSPGSPVALFLLRSLTCWGPWTDLDASVVKKTKIVIWRKHPGSLKTLHTVLYCENIIWLLLWKIRGLNHT